MNLGLSAYFLSSLAIAHDPIFSIGPHVLYKNGVEIATELHGEQSEHSENTLALEFAYGITGDWAVGTEIPYVIAEDENGTGDLNLYSKYRFWRFDTLGVQQSAAVLLRIKFDTGKNEVVNQSTDGLLGFTYGYESIKWYRWISARYQYIGEASNNLKRGDKIFADIAFGFRYSTPVYRKPDTVWYLELNTEYGMKAKQSNIELENTGGRQAFLSPGVFLTLRNFAIKAGVQIPIYQDLNDSQQKDDYRYKVALEWHL